jgi:MFS superfamily sulfate permease-like transporter
MCRLGFIVDFLSHATIVGFMGGAATVVCLQQLKGMLGLHHFTTSTDVVSVMRSLFSQTHQVQHSTALSLFASPRASIIISSSFRATQLRVDECMHGPYYYSYSE